MNKLSKAIFLDRDGVINQERHDYVKTIDELEILPDITKPIKLLKDSGFLIVIVSNQSAINRGLTSHKNVKEIHSVIQEYLKKNGIKLDAIYYCPHRPDENCDCRKPKTGLLLKAIEELGIDPRLSWMIGDNDSDIEAAKKVGCNAIKIGDNISLDFAAQRILCSSHS